MPPTTSIRTGGEIDTICNRCALNLAHTILAMVGPKVVRVKCNTCASEHVYRGDQPLMKTQSLARPRAERAKPAAPRPRVHRAESLATSYEDQFKGRDITRAKKYSVRDTYEEGDVVDHPSFGLGLVVEVRTGGKLEVSFRGGPKTLVHGKGGAPTEAARPSFAPQKHAFHGYADKVPDPEAADEAGVDADPPTAEDDSSESA